MTPRERFNQLPERDQRAILDKHRDINTDYNWWDFTFDNFKADMEAKGVEVDQMYFSGFWCQGDGACFTGRIRNWAVFEEHHKLGLLPMHIEHLADWGAASVGTSGNYSHSGTMKLTYEVPWPDSPDDHYFIESFCPYDDELRIAVYMSEFCKLDYVSFEERVLEACRDHADQLYKELEEEHEHLTSDEAVLETLDANDMLVDEIESITEDEDA
jgi:hypothetical protein